jgi:2-amino-4-hydroxy-6-hydroxymethyldihydropteridine diphosphokinase
MTETAFLGLGSNLGGRLETLQAAVDLLGAEAEIEVVSSSRVWESDPVGGLAQPDFLNAVVRIETSLTPRALLLVCHQVEAALGRVRDVRWGPRTVDVDVLIYGDQTVDELDLTLPHPRMMQRAFVLLPLLELDPDAASADGTRFVDIRLDSEAVAGARPFAPPLEISRTA